MNKRGGAKKYKNVQIVRKVQKSDLKCWKLQKSAKQCLKVQKDAKKC